jgi:hypothetical protein
LLIFIPQISPLPSALNKVDGNHIMKQLSAQFMLRYDKKVVYFDDWNTTAKDAVLIYTYSYFKFK